MQSEKISSAQLRAELATYIGSENWYRHILQRNFLYTDGVKYFCEKAGAYWFLDDFLALQVFPLQMRSPFLVVELKVEDGKAVVNVTNGDGLKLWSRRVHFTDAPHGTWCFYLTDNICLLPSEY